MQSSCGGRGCHGFLSSDGTGKERWCAAEADGAGLVRKNGEEDMGDGDRTAISADESSALGKEDGEKGSGGVGLSEKEGYARPVCCKPVCEVVQAQRSLGLECEGPVIFSSSRLGWALKERETCGPRVCWEEGQPSRGVERASCDGPTNIQWDGLGCVASKPKSGLKEGQPSVEANWASNPHKPFLDNPLKEARASFCRL